MADHTHTAPVPNPGSKAPRRTRRAAAIVCLALVAVYALGAGLLLPQWGRPFLENALSRELGVPCTIGAITVNPLTLKVAARDVVIPYPEAARDKAGNDFALLERLEIIPSPRSLTEKALILGELRLFRPRISVTRFKDGSLSPQLLFPGGATPDNGDDIFPAAVHNLTVRDGTVTVTDALHGTSHVITGIDLSVPFASTLRTDRDVAVTPVLSATVNGKEINVTGETRPFAATRRTEFTLRARELDLAAFRNYIDPYTNLTLQSGSLHSALLLRFGMDADRLDIALAGTVEIADLALADGETPVFSAKRVALDMENVVLGPRRVIINAAVLDSPKVTVHRLKNGSLNWEGYFFLPEDALKGEVRITTGHGDVLSGQAGKPEAGSGVVPLQLVIGNARVTGGTVAWRDDAVIAPVRHVLEDINAEFTDVSTESGGRADFTLGFGRGNSRFTASGKAATAPMRIESAVEARELPLAPFSPYMEEQTGVRLGSGTLSGKGNIIFRHAPDKTLRVTDAAASVTGVRAYVGNHDTPFLEIGRFGMDAIHCDLAARTAGAGLVSGSGLAVSVLRGKDGRLKLPSPPGNPASGAKPDTNPVARPKTMAAVPPWDISVRKVDVSSSRLAFIDNALRTPATFPLTDIAVKGGDFTTIGDTRWSVTVSAKPGARGSLSLTAKGGLTPLDLNFSGTMDKADLRPLSPYLRERTQLTLAEASLGGDFSGSVKRVPGSVRGGAFSLKGSLGVYGVTLLYGKRELGGWGRMRLANVAFSAPAEGGRNLSVESVSVNSPRLAVAIDRNGISSLEKALRPDGAPDRAAVADVVTAKPDETKENPGLDSVFDSLEIGSVAVSLGHANYVDLRVSPPYALKVDGITFGAKKLSFDPQTRSTITGSLSVNGSPVTVSGTGVSLLAGPSGDATVSVRSLDLARFTRYAGKYLGYPVRSGTLNAEISASLRGKTLDIRNHIVIRNLELGSKVRSEHAPDMPLPTAVALLRDMSGVITLDVPVSGTLGDPEFKLGGVVGMVIGNIMLKTVTSPFTLLGSILGGAAGLFSDNGPQSVDIIFPIGEDTLDATAREALEKLGAELRAHPSARIEVIGVADRSEKNMLVDAWVNKALRGMKYARLSPADKAKTTPDAVTVSPTRNAEEYAELLFALYKRLPFVRKSTDPEIRSPQSTRAMMRILRSRVEIGDDQLLLLADARARVLYRSVSRGKIDLAARITLKKSVLMNAEESGERIASCARITIKR